MDGVLSSFKGVVIRSYCASLPLIERTFSFNFVRPASDTSDTKSMELKFKEPELTPERNSRDYAVHFPQEKSQEQAAAKSYKTSGPVIPDTVRYQ